MKTAVLINGYPGAGKDTFVELVKKHFPNTGNVHTSTPAKNAATILGWNGEKTPEDRALLAHLNKMSYDMYGGPYKFVLDIMARTGAQVTFVHVREPERIDQFKEKLKEDGHKVLTLYVNRKIGDMNFSNESDANVWRYFYDAYVDNNEDLAMLEKRAIHFMDKLLTGGFDK